MTDTTPSSVDTPFGVGTLVSDTFSIFVRKIHIVVLLGFIPALIDVILNNYTAGQASGTVPGEEFDLAGIAFPAALTFLVSLVAFAITTAMVVQMAYDAKLGRPTRIGHYFSAALVNLPAIAVLSIVTSILYVLGFLLLFVPGLWLYGVFSVLVPAIVIDGAGFRALNRSAELTRSYRWPIVGTLILVSLCVGLVALVLGFVFGLFLGGFSAQQVGAQTFGAWVIFEAAVNAVFYGCISVSVALIFARLKEIKEGVSVSDLVDVFK